MGDAPWNHNVFTVRLRHVYGGQTLTNVFHLAARVGVPDHAAVAEVSAGLLSAWAVGYGGHVALSASQGAGVVLAGSHAYFMDPFGKLGGVGIDGFLVESPWAPVNPPLPSNVTVAVGGDCGVGGHSGRSWQFFPWLESGALDPACPDRLTASARDKIVDGYEGLAAFVAAYGGPFDIQLAAFHRDSRTDLTSTAVLWWDPIVQYRIRRAGLAEVRVRLAGHKRRRSFGVDR